MKRNSSIEVLRIIAMLLIVQSHFAVHGYMTAVGGDLASIGNSLNRFLITLITTGNIGNGLFMIITGYYLSLSSSYNLRRILRVVIQVLTYSLLCYFFFTLVLGVSSFSFAGLFSAATPLMHDTYWYFSSYILVYIFHPYINAIINNINRKELGLLILFMAIVWGFVPALLGLSFQKSSFLVFCLFYFIGAYLRRYYVIGEGFGLKWISLRFNKKQIKGILIAVVALWFFTALVTAWFTPFYRFVYMASPLIILLSVSAFLLFLNLNFVKGSRLINAIAGCMGGVYLLSDNPFVRDYLYESIFHVSNYIESNSMIIYTYSFVFLTFTCCVFVEFIRKSLYDFMERVFTRTK